MRNPATGGGARDLQAGGQDHGEHTAPTLHRQPIIVALAGCYTASAEGLTVDYEKRRRGSPLCALARKLAAAGYDPQRPLHVFRGSTLCFEPLPLGRWAGLSVAEGDDSYRPAHFVRYRPPPSARKSARSCRCQRGFTGEAGVSGADLPEKATAALATGGQYG